MKPTKLDYEALCSQFAWLPANIVQKTFGSTTQYVHMPYNTVLQGGPETHLCSGTRSCRILRAAEVHYQTPPQHCYKAPHPALNHFCREELVATDMIVSDTPAIDGGKTWAQLFIGTKSLLSDAYGMKTPANFSSTLMDNITQQGAPTKLISD